MDPNRWHRVDELFHRALDADPADRQALLDAAGRADPDVREHAEALLRAHDTDVPVLDGGPEAFAELLDEFESLAGRELGGYRIRRELGRGGMGVVYLAEREGADFDKTVAVKCLLPDLGSADLVDRFRRERRILASLIHPNIAQLYDGGRAESGEYFFVMEYVDGEPLDRYSDRLRLGIDQRLDLFATVCAAVQYAHEHLVVHRDLKPANVLVTQDGHVKLLDFGIAKLIGGEDADDPGRFHTVRLLTPEYASPEQARGEPVTAASDVFALGVILFKLLTGGRPFRREPGQFGAVRSLLDEDAVRPSSSIVRRTASPPSSAEPVEETRTDVAIATARATTPERLRRRLRGDLDTIVEKALRKSPEERYPSAQALLDDVRRHRVGLPILARRAERLYRLRKFAGRHGVALAALAATFIGLLVGLTAAMWQAGIALREREQALAEARKAEEVTDFLVGIFRAADPTELQGEELTVREILDRGAARVEAELVGEPTLRATVRRSIGLVYMNLGAFDDSDRLLEAALEEHERLLGPTHPEVADDLQALATLAYMAGREDADSLAQLAVARRLAVSGPEDPKVASALNGLGLVRMTSNPASADSLFRRALTIHSGASGSAEDVGTTLGNLALLHHNLGDYEEAERLYREALSTLRSSVGNDHSRTLLTLGNLGWLLQLKGSHEAADSVLRQVLAGRRRIYGERHPSVAGALTGVGEVAFQRGAYDEAQQLFEEALSIRRESLPPGHAAIGRGLHMVARAQGARGRTTEALASYVEAIDVIDGSAGSESPTLARAVNDQAVLLEQVGRFVAATAAYRRAHAIYRTLFGDAHAFTALVEGNLASVLLTRDSVEAAEPLLRHSLETLGNAWSNDHVSLGPVLMDLGTVQMRKGSLADAEDSLRRALAIFEQGLPPGHWRIGQARLRLGRLLAATEEVGEAEGLLLSALETLEPLREARPREYVEVLLGLEELYSAAGNEVDARRYRSRREPN